MKLQKLRKTILYGWIIALPIVFNWMSPVLIMFSGFMGYINLSMVIFSIWFLSSLFLGRLYCSYACPWGAMQEIYGTNINKPLDKTKKDKRRKIKYVIFLVWISVIIAAISTSAPNLVLNIYFPNEQNSLVSFESEPNGSWIFYFGIQFLIGVLLTAIIGNRGLCNYGCPMSVLGIIGAKIKNKLKYPSLHLEVDTENCIKCKRCNKVCPMSLEVEDMVQNGKMNHTDCILCGSCIEECPKSVIKYAFRWNKPRVEKKPENQ